MAVIDVNRAPHTGNESGGILGGGVDGASDVQVLDVAVLYVAEECVGPVAAVEGDSVALSVERTGEVFFVYARHAVDGDVGSKLDGLVGEISLGVVDQQVAEVVPAHSLQAKRTSSSARAMLAYPPLPL